MKRRITNENTDVNGLAIHCTRKPAYNVLSQKEFQERAGIIFQLLDDILGKSLGAYGAPTIISNYPYAHVTKDGYTIARNIEFDFREGEEVDRAICRLAVDICGRLNYAVGDGTTTALIATNQIYKAAMKEFPDPSAFRAKELLQQFSDVKDEITEKLLKSATRITEENMKDVIRQIVDISTNGDPVVTDIISNAYDEIGYPSVRTENSDTMHTYMELSKGYHAKVRLTDKIYVNNENGTAEHKNIDVLVFDHQVKRDTYLKILKPIASYSRQLGRHLVCIAPSYDENTIQTLIRRELLQEYEIRKDISLILTTYQAINEYDKKAISDLATILNTTLIDKSLENDILEVASEPGIDLRKYINIGKRGIEGCLIFSGDSFDIVTATGNEVPDEGEIYLLTLGYAETFSGGDKNSVFVSSHYDTDMYQKLVDEAKADLDAVKEKFAILGTYSRDVYEAQYRYTSLRMNTATIFVGGDSTLSRDMLRDAVDDAVRAAESAYEYGYVQGCNVTLSRIISDMIKEETDETSIRYKVLNILREGFISVYRRVLENAMGEESENQIAEIINDSITLEQVYNLNIMDFDDTVINSVKTDIEVLTATVDLLKLLLTGNQMVITNYNHGVR